MESDYYLITLPLFPSDSAEPFGREPFGRELRVERLRVERLRAERLVAGRNPQLINSAFRIPTSALEKALNL